MRAAARRIELTSCADALPARVAMKASTTRPALGELAEVQDASASRTAHAGRLPARRPGRPARDVGVALEERAERRAAWRTEERRACLGRRASRAGSVRSVLIGLARGPAQRRRPGTSPSGSCPAAAAGTRRGMVGRSGRLLEIRSRRLAQRGSRSGSESGGSAGSRSRVCGPARGRSGARAGAPRQRPRARRAAVGAAHATAARPARQHQHRRQDDEHAEQRHRQVDHGDEAEVAQHPDVGDDRAPRSRRSPSRRTRAPPRRWTDRCARSASSRRAPPSAPGGSAR